jgi:WD40 repeat protein
MLTSCVTDSRNPFPDGLPDQDIVFMPDGSPVHMKSDGKTLGFINSDGTNEIIFTFNIVGGARSNFGILLGTQQANYPRWSESGSLLAFSIRSTTPNIRMIDVQGKMYGKECDGLDQVTTFDSSENILGVFKKYSPLYAAYQDQITENSSLVVSYNLKTCTVEYIFSVPVPKNSHLRYIAEAINGIISGEFYDPNDVNTIIVYNRLMQTYDIFPGYYPSLSKDGSSLAYFDESGDIIVRNIDTKLERIVINIATTESGFDPSFSFLPGWSPDNKWLVYNNTQGEIYKVNIDTGENIFLTYGWAPDWRP